MFDVIIVKDAGKIETMRGINDFLQGKHLDNGNPKIELMYGKRITVTSPEKVRIDLDGDQQFLVGYRLPPQGLDFGALMAMGRFCLRMLPGIERPAIAAIWPTARGDLVILDVGATIGGDAQGIGGGRVRA